MPLWGPKAGSFAVVKLEKIAFVGLGTMGAGMARNLVEAGYPVVGYNRTRVKTDLLVSAGGAAARTPAEAAREADVVVLCVSNDAAVDSVVFGKNGVLSTLRTGALVLDCGTTGQDLTRRMSQVCADAGVDFLDAPVTGSKLGAERGTLTFMIGGPGSAVERATKIFAAMGKHSVHVGESIGMGQAAKYSLNMTQAVVLQGILEGYTLARSMGVPLAKMAEIYEHSAGKTGVGGFKTPYLQAADFTPHFRLDLMHKDLHLALEQAASRRIPLAAASAVCGIYDQGVAEGLGGQDFLVLATLLERWSGVQLRD